MVKMHQRLKGIFVPLVKFVKYGCMLSIQSSVDAHLLQESTNPQDDIESFDAVWYAALQVVITATANGVSSALSHTIKSLKDPLPKLVDALDVRYD